MQRAAAGAEVPFLFFQRALFCADNDGLSARPWNGANLSSPLMASTLPFECYHSWPCRRRNVQIRGRPAQS